MKNEKNNFLLGLFIGIAVIAVIGFFVILAVYLNGKDNVQQNLGDNVEQNTQPTQQQPSSPTADITKISPVTQDDYVRGDFSAPITMVIYDDFECPFCLRFEGTLNQVLTEYAGKARLVYRHFPLGGHANAQKAAEASECAGEQGKFWEMHDKIFEANQNGTMGVAQWKIVAPELGLNVSKFNDCLDSGKYADKIAQQYSEGVAAGVRGTPAIFVNDQFVAGALPYEQFKLVVDSELQ